MLFIDNPSIVSKSVIDQLKERVSIIIYNQKPSIQIQRVFQCIDAKALDIKEMDELAIIPKAALITHRQQRDVLHRVLAEYQSEA